MGQGQSLVFGVEGGMNMEQIAKLFIESWAAKEGLHQTSEIKAWVDQLLAATRVHIRKTTLADTGWFYEEASGQIVNAGRTFFQLGGFRLGEIEQPIVLQMEIGYVGILCKVLDGVLHFLMQGKIEPGNVNVVQLSPTIQATKSNFQQKHGGAKPPYTDWFLNAERHTVIVDQIQSEQSSRFWKKRNRNIIVLVDEDTPVEDSPRHRWMTLGQIKELAKLDNYVNMDARTVLSCIPFFEYFRGWPGPESLWRDPPLARSLTRGAQPGIRQRIYRYLNDCKMFAENRGQLIPFYAVQNWETRLENGIEEFVCRWAWPFKVIFCDVDIEGREVRRWGQPMIEAVGQLTLGLLTKVEDGLRYFLVKARQEIGCLDQIELGPTLQLEPMGEPEDSVETLFLARLAEGRGVRYDVVLSEEGGRFYHEQNRNAIVEIESGALPELPPGYFWLTYYTLNEFIQINNICNIQLRNLTTLLEI
jgi:oxidase EvaA